MFSRKLRNLILPHEENNYHPHATRHYFFFAYALIAIFMNLLIFPLLGIKVETAYAHSIQADELIQFANESRESSGLKPLKSNDELVEAAKKKGQNMFEHNYWAHFGPNGESPWDFIKESGYLYSFAGENLAKNFSTSLDTHNAWMNSPTHRDNILNSRFEDIGIAIMDGQLNGKTTTLVVVMFGALKGDTEFDPDLEDEYLLDRPYITKPQNEDVLDGTNTDIEGYSTYGDTIRVYSNGNLLGELPNEEAAFTINVELFEGENILYLKAIDKENSRFTTSSDKVNVYVDDDQSDIAGISSGSQLPPSSSSVIENDNNLWFKSSADFSIAKIVNFTLIGVILVLLVIDSVYIIRHKIKREHSSFHPFSLGVFLIIVLVGVI